MHNLILIPKPTSIFESNGEFIVSANTKIILQKMKDIEYMTFPRLLGIAELAWSPKGGLWEEYRQRLAAHGERIEAMGINFFKSPDVEWDK